MILTEKNDSLIHENAIWMLYIVHIKFKKFQHFIKYTFVKEINHSYNYSFSILILKSKTE